MFLNIKVFKSDNICFSEHTVKKTDNRFINERLSVFYGCQL